MVGDVQSIYVSLASYVGSFVTLSRYSKNHESFCGVVHPHLLNVDDMLYRLKLPSNVPSAIKEDLYMSKITGDTHPGVVTRSLAKQAGNKIGHFRRGGAIHKKHVLHSTFLNVASIWDDLSNGKYLNTVGHYCVGSREKISTTEVGENVKTRPLFIPEFCDILIGST